MDDKIPQYIIDRAAAEIAERNDAIDAFRDGLVAEHRCDAELAPIWAEKLRHTYKTVPETIYPDLVAVNGGLLPIDQSVDPATLEWDYYEADYGAQCDWIDDDGQILHATFITARRSAGKHAEIGGGYHYTIFDLERAAKAGMQLQTISAKAVKRANDEKTEWVWMFGDSGKGIFGLFTHPNLPVSMAALNAGASSRLPENKTNDEVLADFVTLIDQVPEQSLEAHYTKRVAMPHSLIRLMRSRFLTATASGTVTLWDRLLSLYSGDAAGQGKVEFVGLNACDGARRANPNTGTDTSGIAGDFMIALPAPDVEELCFIRARSFTQRPPQETDFTVRIATHSNIGGVKMVRPLSVHMMTFGTT